MTEIYFLAAICAIWLIFASVHDLRTKTVPNWLSFSLVMFALGYRFFYSLFSETGFGFFYQGVLGLGIFFLVGNALYHGRIFAGGDAKLMIALGAVLPFSQSLGDNLRIFAVFLALFFAAGAIYGIFWSLFLSFRNFSEFRKEFAKEMKKAKMKVYSFLLFGIALLGFGFYSTLFFYLGILVFIFPYLYVFAKSVDNSCLVKEISTRKLEEGDWIYRDTRVGRETIKASWHGLTTGEISRIRKKYGKIKVREGIAFSPVFLISFLLLVYLWLFNFEPVGNFIERLW
jgi:Flp pilus assembly protein protease CpaA